MSRGRTKKNWKFKFNPSLSLLQLVFPSLRTELRGGGGGGGGRGGGGGGLALSNFQCVRRVEPWGEVKNFCKVNTLFVVFGHWVIERKFIFEHWVEKSGKMSVLHSIRPEKRLEERLFVKKSYNCLSCWTLGKNFQYVGDKLLAGS